MSWLQIAWFFLIGFLFLGYALLDGYDLGLGFWHLVSRDERTRRTIIKAIGPLWDGNEVWLVTGGASLFAAFPPVYATVFSGFYLALMLLLLALVARGVSIEFRNQVPDSRWHGSWDLAFSLGSILPGLLLGVALGNILRGLPLSADQEFTGSFFTLLNPYALLIGILSLAVFTTHGALYLATRTDGEIRRNARSWGQKAWGSYAVLFVIASLATCLTQPHLTANFRNMPILLVIPAGTALCIAAIGHFNSRGQDRLSLAASGLSIVAIMCIAGASLFPNIVPALGAPDLSMTLANSSSSPLTLKIMLILTLSALPFIIAYTIWVHSIFGGKVEIDEDDGH